ncbi:MAG: hypothetical protein PVF84_01300, partial [Desulfuromonadales bacterium]
FFKCDKPPVSLANKFQHHISPPDRKQFGNYHKTTGSQREKAQYIDKKTYDLHNILCKNSWTACGRKGDRER